MTILVTFAVQMPKAVVAEDTAAFDYPESCGYPSEAVTVLEGISNAFPDDDAKEADSSEVSGEEEMNICEIIHS